MKQAERIVFNTGILYVRLIVVMFLGLLTTRFVLDALGETNYGIYTLVAGVVGMLAVLQSAMSNTSMRYMAHSLGSGNKELVARTFNNTLFLHTILGLLVVMIIEVGGYFMFNYFLQIPENKLFDAKVVFHLMALTTFVAIIAVPYDAVINSHENLIVLSLVDFIGAILKLGLALYLTFSKFNLLILYGIGMFLIQVILRLIKQHYSLKHYPECELKMRQSIDKRLLKEIFAFSGWNLLGSIASMSITQIRSILLNMFFGVNVNASEGIAKRGSSQINMVSVNLTRAINPVLIKTEGAGNRQKMILLTNISTKFSIFLFALFAIPVLIELPFLFNIWLKKVPEYAVIFTRLTLIVLLIEKFTFEITNAIRAIGNIRAFQITESIIVLLNLPVSYILFKNGYPPQTIYVVSIFIAIVSALFRLYFGKKIVRINILHFIKKTVIPSLLPLLFSLVIGYFFTHVMKIGPMRFVFSTLFSISCLIITIRYFSLSKYELEKINQVFISFKNKF